MGGTNGVIIADGDSHAVAVALNTAIKQDDARYYADFVYLLQESGNFGQGLAVANAGTRRLRGAASLYVARGVIYGDLGRYKQSAAISSMPGISIQTWLMSRHPAVPVSVSLRSPWGRIGQFERSRSG